MAIGLKRGVVELADHDPEWEQIARDTIGRLWRVFGSVAKDIQHVGSTAIHPIKAKPIIDIAVAVEDFDKVMELIPALTNEGFIHKSEINDEWQVYFVCHDFENDIRTHNIHVVKGDRKNWMDYLLFRDYLNSHPDAAYEYERVKLELVKKYKNDRVAYCDGKTEFCLKVLRLAQIWENFGKIFVKIEPINKGWSNDKKYYIETADGQRMLLRISDEEHDRKKTEYCMMERVYELGILTPQPLGFGLCAGGKSVYSLSGWLDGEDAEKALPFMSETEQYVVGWKAGETLRKIHTIPAPADAEPWGDWFYRKVQGRIDFYNANPIKTEKGDKIVYFLQHNKYLLDNRPQSFNHGDFNKSNLMVMPDRQIGVIDFNAYNRDHGDPWWEFDPTNWGSEPNACFCTGLINGYFGGSPPSEFFQMHRYYLAYDALAALCDTSVNNQGEAEEGRRHLDNVLRWFENMNNPVPTWYLKDLYIQWIDGVPYKLKAPFDFSFLSKYGKVFKVFDQSSSGCICFGMEKEGKRYFLKFAGAHTANDALRNVEDTILRLKYSVPKYKEMKHPLLVNLVDAVEVGGGFMTVFDWFNGESFGYPQREMCAKFMALPLEEKQRVYEGILEFHAHAAACGYTAIDFNDQATLYNFDNGEFLICDIDFYAKQYYMNGYGGIWGDPSLMAPEEKRSGAVVDEISNVYAMGATAFVFFAEDDKNARDKWVMSDELYTVAKKAVNDDRRLRQQSIRQLIEEWRAAGSRLTGK